MAITIRSLIETALRAGNPMNPAILADLCRSAGIDAPATAASAAVAISNVRKALGLPGPRSRKEPEEFVVEGAETAPEPVVEETHAPRGYENGMVPPIDKTLVIPEITRTMFNVLHRRAQAGQRPKLLLTGPAGCGKSSMAQAFAAFTRRPFFEFAVPNTRESRDWFGSRGLDDKGRPNWFLSQFVDAIRTPGAVILLDEVNRATPTVANVLLPLLDHRAGTYFEEAKTALRVAPGVVWFGTANEGRSFAGTFLLDGAFRDRFSTRIKCDYLTEKEEIALLIARTGIGHDVAQKLVEVAGLTRLRAQAEGPEALDEGISTRSLLEAAQNWAYAPEGKGNHVLVPSLVNAYPDAGGEASQASQVLQLLIGKFGPLA